MIREFGEKVAAGDSAGAGTALRQVFRTVDKGAAKGIMHKKTASRRKSRLAKRLNKMAAAK